MSANRSRKSRLMLAAVRGIVTGVVLGGMFLAGYLLRDQAPVAANVDAEENEFPLLHEVKDLLEKNYLRPLPDDRTMEYAALRGFLGELNDPYTFFIDPPVAQSESHVLAGEYGGIGVQVQRNEQGDLVLYPFPDGPAARAGVEEGAILLAIDGMPLPPGERIDVVDGMLRGEVGGGRGVTITIRAPESDESRDVFIEFEVVQVPSIVWRMLAEEDTFGYVQIIRFTSRTPDELRTAIEDLKSQGAVALVLDLRGNSGGLLQESVEVASEFLDGGVVFYEVRRNGETTTEATPGGAWTEGPLVVLVDSGTASAAELVAGAIRDHERGILIGQRTYGKGSVQLIFRLSDGSSVHITSAEWFTPNRTPLEGNGLEPTISMIPDESGRDVELGEAVRQLREMVSAQAAAPRLDG
jgi:carboxyl-terminal processing protease